MNYYRVHLHAKDEFTLPCRLYYVVKADTAEEADEKAIDTSISAGFTEGIVVYNQKLLDTGVYLCTIREL